MIPELLTEPTRLKQSLRRYQALWFPFLATQRVRPAQKEIQPDAPPFILVGKKHGALVITSADRRALELGLMLGMPLANARARVPLLELADCNLKADHDFLLRLAALCEVFTPRIALEPPDGLMLDITGCAHLFGGEEELRLKVGHRLSRLGLSVRTTIASTPDAARALARFSRAGVVVRGTESKTARALPIGALECASEIILALHRAGLTSLDDLASRPSQMLSARFGMDVATKLRRIMAQEDICITPLRTPPVFLVEQHFPEPRSSLENLLNVIADLLDELGTILETAGMGGREFELTFFRSDGALRRLQIDTAKATRNSRSLLRLIRLKIETLADPIDPGFGFDAIRIGVLLCEKIIIAQRDLDGTTPEDLAITELIDRLIARFGARRVLRFTSRDTHNPLRAAARVSALSPLAESSWAPLEPGEPPLRPLTLFSAPHPIEAMAEVPDGPPIRFRWRRVLYTVARAEGPERIAAEWWRDGAMLTRDYFRIEDTLGHRFWLFREGLYEHGGKLPRWFLHGLFS